MAPGDPQEASWRPFCARWPEMAPGGALGCRLEAVLGQVA
jgi:hypothetical protein